MNPLKSILRKDKKSLPPGLWEQIGLSPAELFSELHTRFWEADSLTEAEIHDYEVKDNSVVGDSSIDVKFDFQFKGLQYKGELGIHTGNLAQLCLNIRRSTNGAPVLYKFRPIFEIKDFQGLIQNISGLLQVALVAHEEGDFEGPLKG